MTRRTRIHIAAGVPIVTGVIVGVCIWLHDWPAHHFAEVEAGVLYRSAQPSVKDLRRLRDHYGIRTIVNLRTDRPDASCQRDEIDFCHRNGIEYVQLPISDDGPTGEQLEQFLVLIGNPASQPVLVHCEYGKSRTGVMVAAFRIASQGWTAQRAIAESQAFKSHMRSAYAEYLRHLEREVHIERVEANTRGTNISDQTY